MARSNGGPVARNVKRISHLDLPGAGQVYVAGNYAYIGHIPNKQHIGTSIVDIADPKNPKVVSQIVLDDHESHSHKARVVGDIMIVNHERNNSGLGRKAEQLPPMRARLEEALGRAPTDAELAEKLGVEKSDIPALIAAEKHKYQNGGFKVYDVSDPSKPKELCHQKTGGIGVHRYDMDENYAYISTEMDGYVGNILVIYDINKPDKPQEVSRWWMEGQHLAGGEKPTWTGRQHRLHHALRFGDKMYAGCWQAGLRIIDIADIRNPKTVGAYTYHPPFPEPTHTVMPLAEPINGRQIAVVIDEEDQFYNAAERDARKGRPHAPLWVFDITDLSDIKPLSMYQVSELDSPWSQAVGARFGAHQFQEKNKGTLVFCAWFSGGLRIVDVADPFMPKEVGYFIPEPVKGQPAPQSNDTDFDHRDLIHMVDRYVGFDILEYEG
ncbi:MAG: hypothetical protein RIB59_00455 [Rhodospirillales bacterium]